MAITRDTTTRPIELPRDDLYRALGERVEIRDGVGAAPAPVLHGHFAVFNTWAEIDSLWEGRFLERIAPGAFRKTFRENRDAIRVLFQHGRDPQVGNKPLGPIEQLGEDDDGAAYTVSLLDTEYVRELLPGLRAGLYGSSFKFRVIKEDVVEEPGASEWNPDGLPERTIREMRVFEFGPVTFPAYGDATAMVRSLTDDYREDRGDVLSGSLSVDSGNDLGRATIWMPSNTSVVGATTFVVEVDDALHSRQASDDDAERDEGAGDDHSQKQDALPDQEPAQDHSEDEGSREADDTSERQEDAMKLEELRARLNEIRDRLTEIHREYGTAVLPSEVQAEFDDLVAERAEITTGITSFEERARQLAEYETDERKTEREEHRDPRRVRTTATSHRERRVPTDVHALEEYRLLSNTPEQLRQALRDGAMYAVEQATFPHERANREKVQAHIADLLDRVDNEDRDIARLILATGSAVYVRAFGKALSGTPLTNEEARALSLTDNAGGYAVPYTLDPTVVPTSDGAINPLRQIARVETITGDVWQGVTSAGITVSRATEAAQASDNAPTLAGPSITPSRVHAWVPFSYEIGQDWAALQSEIARMLSDAKDEEEASSFISGDGSPPNPTGVVAGLALTSHVTTDVVNGFASDDLYKLKGKLPPRFRARASWLGNDSIYSLIRQFDTSGGADLWTTLGEDRPQMLIGKPAYEASEMTDTATDGDDILLYGDFGYYCIVDRVGMMIRYVPDVFGANQRPTGQSGYYAFWRNGADILSDNAFRLLVVGLTS